MKCDWRIVLVLACLFFGLGVAHSVWDEISRWGSSIRADQGYVQANIALLGLGVVALFVALALRNLEERLRRIERSGINGNP
jgi:hypothetical protein